MEQKRVIAELRALAKGLFGSGYVGAAEMLTTLIDELKPQSEWISVDDRLPEDDVQVQVMVNGEDYTTGQYDSQKHGGAWKIGNTCISWDYDFAFGCEMEVTHWMPLPAPPSEQ